MPTFDREAAKRAGFSDKEIEAYLASPQGRVDSESAGAAPSEVRRTPLALEAIPAAGGILGGIAGTPFGPIGIGGGAGLGAAGGEALKQQIARAMGFSAPAGGEAVGDIALAGGVSAITGGAMPLIGAGTKALAPAAMKLVSPRLGGALGRLFGGAAKQELKGKGALSGVERINAMRPLRANASREARVSHALELEQAMKEAGLDAAAKRTFREAFGHGAARAGVAESRVPAIAQAAAKTKPVRPKAPRLGEAASRIPKAAEPFRVRGKSGLRTPTVPSGAKAAPKPATPKPAAAKGGEDLEDVLRLSNEVEEEMARRGLGSAEKEVVRQRMRKALDAANPAERRAAIARTQDFLKSGKEGAKAAASRHEVQYFSESQGKFLNIEDMHISQLRNAMNKLQGKLGKFKDPAKQSPVQHKVLEAMKDEVKHRFKEAGSLTIP